MRGIVEKIWQNETTKGKPYLTLMIDGERYSVWDQKYFDQLQEGDEVEYKWRQSGDFRNITKIGRVNDEELTSNQRRMTRMGCLKYASGIVSLTEGDLKEKASYAIAMARDFEQYVLEPEFADEE